MVEFRILVVLAVGDISLMAEGDLSGVPTVGMVGGVAGVAVVGGSGGRTGALGTGEGTAAEGVVIVTGCGGCCLGALVTAGVPFGGREGLWVDSLKFGTQAGERDG